MLISIRKFITVFVLLFVFSFNAMALNEASVSASSAVLIDGDTLEVLFSKNADKVRSMASTTKIMTALLAVESGKLNEIITVKEKIYIEGTAIGFSKGDKISLEDVCYGMLLESGNDAAVLAAEYLAGSEKKFSVLMNKKAKEIGMTSTNFVTASGLDDEEHYTTAYDMALLGAYAVKNEKFREICSSKTHTADFIEPDITRNFSNHNKLLRYCEGVYGIKTGFTKKSGRCLVSACERNGKTLVAVTLNAPDDWNDHERLYEYGYSLYQENILTAEIPDEVIVAGSDKRKIKISCYGDESVFTRKNKQLEYSIYINRILYAPINKNDVIGKLVVLNGDYIVAEMPIIALEKAGTIKSSVEYKEGLFDRLSAFFKGLFVCRKG